MIRRPPRSTLDRSSAASDVYKRQVLESNTQIIANQKSWREPCKRRKIENLALMLQGAIEAQGRVGLMLNVRKQDLEKVLNVLPALRKPTISTLSDDAWVAVNTIIE